MAEYLDFEDDERIKEEIISSSKYYFKSKPYKEIAKESTASLGINKPINEISSSVDSIINNYEGFTDYNPIETSIRYMNAKIHENRNSVAHLYISTSTDFVQGNITSSGNISSSGTIIANKLEADQLVSHAGDANTGLEFSSDTVVIEGNNIALATFNTSKIDLNKPITASHDISSSGNIYMKQTTGTDNSVVVLDSDGMLKTDEIDGAVWGGAGGLLATDNVNEQLAGVNLSEVTVGTATTATTATNVTATANNTTNETTYITFVDGTTGAQGIETDTGLKYNPSTNIITATASLAKETETYYTWEATTRTATGDDDNWQGPNTKGILTMEDWGQDYSNYYDDTTSTYASVRTYMNTGWIIPHGANYSCSIKSFDIYMQPNTNQTYADADGFSCSLWYSKNSDLISERNVPDANSGTFVQRHAATITDSQCKAADEKFFKYNNYHVSQSVNLDLAPGSIIFPRIKSVGTNDFIMNIHWIVNYTKIPL